MKKNNFEKDTDDILNNQTPNSDEMIVIDKLGEAHIERNISQIVSHYDMFDDTEKIGASILIRNLEEETGRPMIDKDGRRSVNSSPAVAFLDTLSNTELHSLKNARPNDDLLKRYRKEPKF